VDVSRKLRKPILVDRFGNRPIEGGLFEVKDWKPEQVLSAAYHENIQHIVQLNNPFYQSEKEYSQALMDRENDFFASPWSFSKKGIADRSRPLLLLDIHRASDKYEILSQVEFFLMTCPGTRKFRQEILLLSDELIVNIQNIEGGYDVASGCFFISIADDHILLGTRDSAGVLSPQKIISNALKCYTHGVIKSINQEGKGAGIGSYYMFECASSMTLAVQPAHCTVVSLTIPLATPIGDTLNSNKNLHWLVKTKD
jgi:hypothetical protein